MKRSGFAVTIKAFFPAEATDGDAMVKALNTISDALIKVAEVGIVEDVQQRYMLSREVPDAPKPVEARVAEPINATAGPAGDVRSGQLNGPMERMPEIPAAQRRT